MKISLSQKGSVCWRLFDEPQAELVLRYNSHSEREDKIVYIQEEGIFSAGYSDHVIYA